MFREKEIAEEKEEINIRKSAVRAFYYTGLTIGQITILPRVNGFFPDLL